MHLKVIEVFSWPRPRDHWGCSAMCAILDVNVANQVFGELRPEAGVKFFDWLNSGLGRLVLGGRLREELNKTSARDWLVQGVLAGRVRSVSETKVD